MVSLCPTFLGLTNQCFSFKISGKEAGTILGVQIGSQISKNTSRFFPRLSHRVDWTLKAVFWLVSTFLTLQVYSYVVGCHSFLLSGTHILYSIETLPSLGFWWVKEWYFSAHPGLIHWLGIIEVVLLPLNKSSGRLLAETVGEVFKNMESLCLSVIIFHSE